MREFGSEFHIGYARDDYFDDMTGLRPYHAYTRSGREAIGLAAMTISGGLVLMPAYCCWSMVMPVEEAGCMVEYYRLNENLSVDIDYLLEMIDKKQPRAILLMDYFGFAPTRDVISVVKAKHPDMVVIEDFTQSLFRMAEIENKDVDFYVASIRKSVGVPDGGVVLSKRPLPIELLKTQITPFVSLHESAGKKKTRYLYSADAEQKTAFRNEQSLAGEDIKKHFGLFRMSETAQSVIRHTIAENVGYARKCNYEHVYRKISSIAGMKCLFAPTANNQAPFMMVVLVDHRAEVQAALAKKGVYAQVLWPLNEKQRQCCEAARYMEEHMLALPIDQRYDWDGIEEMSNRIIEVMK